VSHVAENNLEGTLRCGVEIGRSLPTISEHGSQKLRVDPPSREATARQVVESVEAPLEPRTFTELKEADLLGRMHVRGALNHRVWRVGVHHVNDHGK
jgi:hypothetical protein